jgi:uncharacterized protein YkwD
MCGLLAVLPLLPALLWPAAALQAAGAPALSTRQVMTVLQGYRTDGCASQRGVHRPLRPVETLRAAALRWSEGAPLQLAIDGAGYRAEGSVALQYRGSAAGLRAAVLQRLCRPLTQMNFSDVGLWTQGDSAWILLASPFRAPSASSAAAVAQALLGEINRARSRPRRCGPRAYAAAAPLQLDERLMSAAARHAQDMLGHNFFAHQGSDGSTPAARVAGSGYRFRMVAENIAEGAQSVGEAVQGWLASPGHCENIMDPGYRQTGVAFAVSRRGEPRIYWVQDFGAPAP